ncbi:hypothetical protein BO71DRAFT_481946 [Aspergillus ellipticus CBS 707.79]|uniref:Zn(2)-C6 fungal-type domain-containing protein n=1 Tax=Aspergillus ellipticus CBS 707.79 TaxID=1448320 RepID=A0A319DGM6_9EURO|nr:hypothetical protein BO71DRAFT_481946 [Aspergillus ellipticus CBS 707.79]
MTASKPSAHRPRRTHALGACKTCRRRHAKCDQRRPACQMCRAAGLTCEGFTDDIRWMPARRHHPPSVTVDEKGGDAEKKGRRRHLYTEKSRLSMSDALSADLVSGSIDASLAEIDNRSREPERSDQGDIVIGPFGVLDLAPAPNLGSNSAVLSTPQAGPAEAVAVPQTETRQSGSSPAVSPCLSQESIAYMNDLLQWSDLLSLDPQMQGSVLSTHLDLGDWLSLESGAQLPAADYSSGNGTLDTSDQTSAMYMTASDQSGLARMMMTPQQTPMDFNGSTVDVLTDAQYLLRHFQDHVISRMMAIPLEQKSPWKIFNVPSAVVTYSDLTFLGSQSVSHARLANLYCLLACSALHLTVDSSMGAPDSKARWKPIADHTYHLAKDHMQMSLKQETHEPKKAKYKDQLMAICALTEFAILSGQQQDARCYMVDAERLLRLRGLPKRRISQKARLLHHVYTWLRIVGESTYVLHDYTPSDSFTEALKHKFQYQKVEYSTQIPSERNPRLDDFLRLDRRPADSDLNIDEPKETNVGLHDIHLEDSRKYPDTLYCRIYGVSETWLSLVSQTTRLANVMETFRVARESCPTNRISVEAWEALHRRSVRLESMVCAFNRRKAEEDICDSTSHLAKSHESILHALNSALVIFFYRRIRQVHPIILEGQVDRVISKLGELDAALTEASHSGPGTAWPLFIAG